MKALCALLLTGTFNVLIYHVAHGDEIINGRKAERKSFEYMVSVQEDQKHKCGGFLINSSYVLTAAHCNTEDLTVVVGTHNIEPNTNDLRRYNVQRKHVYPFYQNAPNKGYDIMLLKLSGKLNLKTIGIPSKYQQLEPNIQCQVAGWGDTGNNSPLVNYLMVADVPTVDITECKEAWLKRGLDLPHFILCAGGYKTESGACQGDSGGPLICDQMAVGIVSFNRNYNCDYPDVPNVYTDISAYADWINSIMKDDD